MSFTFFKQFNIKEMNFLFGVLSTAFSNEAKKTKLNVVNIVH